MTRFHFLLTRQSGSQAHGEGTDKLEVLQASAGMIALSRQRGDPVVKGAFFADERREFVLRDEHWVKAPPSLLDA